MYDIIVKACPIILPAMAIFNLVALIYFIKSYKENKNGITVFMGAITFGLLYDSVILSLGMVPVVTNQTEVFAILSQFRFILHGAVIPFMFPICAYALTEFKKPRKIVLSFTYILAIGGLLSGVFTILERAQVGSVIRYMASDASPAWVTTWSNIFSFGSVIPLIICGLILLIKKHTPMLFLSGLLMFIFAAIGPATGLFDLIFVISMFGEAFMVLFFILHDRWLANRKFI